MKRILSLLIVLSVSIAMVAAADASEMYQLFSDAVNDGDTAAAMDLYGNLQNMISKDYKKAERSYEKALEAGNIRKAREAYSDMLNVSGYSITREQSDALLSAILKGDESSRAENAAWLYENSPYYSPSVTYDWSAKGDNFSYSYKRSISVTPGSEITLPTAEDIGADTSAAGVLVGWGITPDEVTYQPGEVIIAPYTSQTYYAVWKTAVSFKDDVTGIDSTVDGTATGESVDVPAVTAPDDSYIFTGWVDKTTGEYIAPDETSYELEGNGAAFTALWKKVDFQNLTSRHYDTEALPVGTQVDLSFEIANSGSEDIRNAVIEVESSDPGLTVLNGEGNVRFIAAGCTLTMNGLRVAATEPGTYTINVSLTDRDDDVWTGSFSVTAD